MLRHIPEPLLLRLRAYAAAHTLPLRGAILALLEHGLDHMDARSRGGKARSEEMSAGERRDSASRAAQARWSRTR